MTTEQVEAIVKVFDGIAQEYKTLQEVLLDLLERTRQDERSVKNLIPQVEEMLNAVVKQEPVVNDEPVVENKGDETDEH